MSSWNRSFASLTPCPPIAEAFHLMASALDVLVFYVPVADTEDVLAAVFAAGGGRVGDYEQCAFIVEGRG